jgi:hypothetical protein
MKLESRVEHFTTESEPRPFMLMEDPDSGR